MLSLDKVKIPADSEFNLERAMELANLISVAYNEYEVWDNDKNLQKKDSLPEKITGSRAFIELHANQIEKFQTQNKHYNYLDQFWQQKPDKLETYERIHSFAFPQWWWADLFKLDGFLELFNSDIRDIIDNLTDLVTTEQIFGFIARSTNHPRRIFVVFRGTREAAEWFNNFRPKPAVFLKDKSLGEVRNGFNLIYTSEKENPNLDKFLSSRKFPPINETIAQFFETELTNGSEVFITGHSLGAGLATLAALHIHKIAEKKNVSPSIQLYTIASPRVGDETFAKYFDNFEKIKSFRIINSEDIIQSIPFPSTQVVDDETFNGMSESKKRRFEFLRNFLKRITGGQSEKHYQHVGIPITFTKQTGTIAGNHNLTETYRKALDNS
ncbi:lipase class 3 (plasmid) [Nostoc sp. NIES-2111]|nr:lipase class 3 [Nostoc sp. NIES-2111]